MAAKKTQHTGGSPVDTFHQLLLEVARCLDRSPWGSPRLHQLLEAPQPLDVPQRQDE